MLTEQLVFRFIAAPSLSPYRLAGPVFRVCESTNFLIARLILRNLDGAWLPDLGCGPCLNQCLNLNLSKQLRIRCGSIALKL